MASRMFLACCLVLGLGTAARGEKKVDWSEYLEPPGSPGPPIKHAAMPAAPKPTAAAPVERPAPKKAAKRASPAKQPRKATKPTHR
jgi:hypothetical protein